MQEPAQKEYECHSCGSIYEIRWDPDDVELKLKPSPDICPFCSSGVKAQELDTDGVNETGYLGGEPVDYAGFGKGIDWMDDE